MIIPQSFIQELLSRVDIVEVVGRSVKLKKAGANYQGLCPFHNEKTPSFSVSPTKQFYHCFGCGASGDAIKFLTENFGMSFVDAVQDLAHGIGLDVPRVAGGPEADAAEAARKQGLTLVQWLEKADHYYRQRLRETPAAIAYFRERGVSGETARDFGLGYAPGGWRNLDGVLPDYAAKEAVDAGLVIAGDEGKRYDRFRERVMFPIRNPRGQVIGFGGRVLGAGEPKYLNSPEGPLFSKGRELYGLFEARDGIRAAGRVLVVEGYMDVVMLHQHGCKYAVATLGTATTAHHLQKLTRLADRIVFAFDGDAAGRRAAWRALENALPLLSDTRQLDFLFLPPEHDPDSFVRAEGLEAFEAEVEQALPLSTFLLKELAGRGDLTTPEGRARMQAELKPLVLQMPDIALRTQILIDMAGRLGLAPEDLFAWCGIRQVRGPGHHGAPVPASGRRREWQGGARRTGDGSRQGGGAAQGPAAFRRDRPWGAPAAGMPAEGFAPAPMMAEPWPDDRQGGAAYLDDLPPEAWQGGGADGSIRDDAGAWHEGEPRQGGAAQAGRAGRSDLRGSGSRSRDGRDGGGRRGDGRWNRNGGQRGDAGGARGLPALVSRTRPKPPTLQQQVCLLLAYHPSLAREPLEDTRFLSESLLGWRDQLAALPEGAHFAAVLSSAREHSPKVADFIERLDERDAGATSGLDLDEARKTYHNALARIRLDEVRREIVRVVNEGLDKPEGRARYGELAGLMKQLSDEGHG